MVWNSYNALSNNTIRRLLNKYKISTSDLVNLDQCYLLHLGVEEAESGEGEGGGQDAHQGVDPCVGTPSCLKMRGPHINLSLSLGIHISRCVQLGEQM